MSNSKVFVGGKLKSRKGGDEETTGGCLESFSAKDLFHACSKYGHIVDSFIPSKRSKEGKRFGFVRFINVFNAERPSLNNRDTHDPRKNVRNSGANVVGTNGGSVGIGNTFANVLSKKPVPKSDVIESEPVIVLDDDCVQSQDLTLTLMGKVLLEFKSLKVKDLFCENVGVKSWFSEIIPASIDFFPDGRIVWVDVEGVPFKFWTTNTFSRIAAKWGKMLEFDDIDENCYHSRRLCVYTKIHSNIFENSKIVFKGKVFWLRAKGIPSWEPEFLEIDDEEERSDKASMEGDCKAQEDEFSGNFSDNEEVSETVFENASGTKQNASGTKVNVSEDPFGIYSILNKKNVVNAANEATDSHSIPHPPGFTPVQEKACEDNDQNIEHSKSNSGSKEEEAFKEDLNSRSDKEGYVNMGRFKTTEAPRSGGSFLNLMEDVVKDKRMVWDYLSHMINQWKGSVVIMGDFNEVRFKSDRFGSIFNEKGADEFNSFIANSGLEEVSLGGCNFTWCHKSAAKMSKLDSGTNALCVLISKMKFLKNRIREWIKVSRVKTNGDIQYFKEELRVIEEVIDNGEGSDTVLTKRRELTNDIKRIEQLKAMEIAQKSKINWAIEGDENSRFFHGMLNKKRNQLNIRGIMVNGDWIDNPFEVKHEFFNHFWDRFANSEDTRITIDMTFPKQISNDQKEELERALTKDELKAADVFDAVNYFFNNRGIPKGGNPFFITLIPKIHAANLVKDFRPICLIGSIYKIVAKILANRLVGVLDNIVHEVQSAFISGRQILDGPFILNEILQWCKTKKKQSLIFKVDFEKAFDSVRWDFLDDVLKKFGFCPTEEFQFCKGLKQGLNLSNSMCLSHMFYADDVVFVGKWSDENINTLTNVLECFHRASGLKINMSKRKIMGVNVDGNKVNLVASKLGCLSLYSPFSYLGTKVGDTMSRSKAWKEVVDKVKNRLSKWKMKALSIGGRLTLLKSALGSIPIFHMSIFRAPLTEKVLAAKDKGGLGVASLYALNRGLLIKWFWRFYNQETSLWKNVIQAIHARNCNVHSINKSAGHSCWTTIIKEIHRLGVSGLNIFDFMKQKVCNGNTIKFWTDNWYNGGILKDIYPRLYALENRKDITVSSKLADPHLNTSFRRDIIGGCELEQFQMFVDLVDSITLAPMEDRWVWNLEHSGEFSVASIRRKIDDSRFPTIGDKIRWVKFVPIKINVFAWKVTVNALPTRYNLSRRGMDIQSLSCPMCDCGIESTDHVFVGCDVFRQLGRMISNWWNTPLVEMDTIAAWKTWFSSIRLARNLKSIFEGLAWGTDDVSLREAFSGYGNLSSGRHGNLCMGVYLEYHK
nr:RNA-directed DNA polymerase, eukaryota, reverse transcriptase zinc-binding domain protein [Tanacetum cinerariifolium]